MKQFESPRQVLRFLSVHDPIANLFSRRPDHQTTASAWDRTFQTWNQTGSLGHAA